MKSLEQQIFERPLKAAASCRTPRKPVSGCLKNASFEQSLQIRPVWTKAGTHLSMPNCAASPNNPVE
jgi:hypothetical protein